MYTAVGAVSALIRQRLWRRGRLILAIGRAVAAACGLETWRGGYEERHMHDTAAKLVCIQHGVMFIKQNFADPAENKKQKRQFRLQPAQALDFCMCKSRIYRK
jgi:hypothetical protein